MLTAAAGVFVGLRTSAWMLVGGLVTGYVLGPLAIADGARAFVDELTAPRAPAPEVVLGGAALVPPAAARGGDVWVDLATLPALTDHRVRGAVVIPLALGVEWLVRALGPEPGPRALREVAVRRGVVLPDPPAIGLAVRARATTAGAALELVDRDGGVRIAAHADAPRPPTLPPSDAAPTAALDPRAAAPYCPGRLFHGPQFHALRAITALSADGGVAELAGLHALGWPGRGWRTDVAAIDGAIQLAALICTVAGMGQTLPLAVARIGLHREPRPGPLTAAVVLRTRAADRALCDAWVIGHDGAPVAELTGLALFVAPRGTTEA